MNRSCGDRLTRRSFLRLAAGAGALGLGGALGACGALPATPAATPLVETTITLWSWVDDAAAGVIRGFEQANPQIKVKVENYRYDVAHGRFASALSAGSGAPDVFIADISSMGALREQPGLADLGGPPFDAAQLKGDFLPALWDHAAFQGRLVALPWNLGVGVGWYRADVFEAAGLPTDPSAVGELARSWTDWLALDRALREKSPKVALVAESLRLFPAAAEQQGHGWVEGERLLVEEKLRPAAELLGTLYERDVPAELAGATYARAMIEGGIAGMVDGSWQQYFLLQDFRATAGKWRITRAPGGDFGSGALYLVIPQQSRQQEAAWTLARYLGASAAGQNLAFAASGALPAYKPAWQDGLYDQPVEFFGGQVAYRLLTQAAEGIPPGVVSPLDRQVEQVVWQEAGRVARNGKDPAQALADAEKTILQQIQGLVG
jgi:ABC-type glycerol-3-phosphate transport system substrate-binding protein